MYKKTGILIILLFLFASYSPVAEAAEAGRRTAKPAGDSAFSLYLFEGEGCPHCAEEKQFLNAIGKKYPRLRIKDYEVWHNRGNADLLANMSKAFGIEPRGVPVTFIGYKSYVGFSPQVEKALRADIEECTRIACPDPAEIMSSMQKVAPTFLPPVKNTVKPQAYQDQKKAAPEPKKAEEPGDVTLDLPLVGSVRGDSMSLPALTVVIAGLDSFNPCAFFVLFSLLGILIHAHSRTKMIVIGGIFVFFSGLIYFIFMAAWLNMFLLLGHVAIITTIAGVISIIIAAINIKDFFWFKEGVSLTITDTAQSRLFDRMRKLLKTSSMPSIIFGTVVLAVAANSYELLCTAGFPMVYTRILTLNNLSPEAYYFYLTLYNVIYVIPLAIIVIGLSLTLGRRALTEREGRVLKLVSGFMMLGLGLTLVFAPELLNNMIISMLILSAAIGTSAIIALLFRKKEEPRKKKK
jgi:glutaredoxin